MKILFVRPNKDSFGFKPIGLSLLSGIARESGFDTRLFDTTEIDFGFEDNNVSGEKAKIFKPVDAASYGLIKKKIDLKSAFKNTVAEYKPDLLAFSVLSDEYLIAADISMVIRKEFGHIPIIWGGKHPTLEPEETLKSGYADFVCVGEGLDAFKEFVEALDNGKDLYNIQNIWGLKGEKIIKNKIRPLRCSLDDLPYADWAIYDKRNFFKPFDGKVYVGGDHMLNWGCPYHCTYCINHFYYGMHKNKYFMRRYSVKRIIEELKFLKERYNLGFFKFHDEDFLMRPVEGLRELCAAYKKEVNLPFVIETNPRSVTREKAALLKDMNCVSASMGIETGDPYLRRKILNRADTEKDILRAFLLLKDAGIRTVSFNMLGIPYETRRAYMKTVEINKKAGVQYPNATFFYPFKGTALRETAIKEGLFNPEEKETLVYRRSRPALRFEDLTEEQLVEMRNVFVLYVKLPCEFRRFIELSERKDETGRLLRKRLLEIYDKTVWSNNGWYRDDGLMTEYIRELEDIIRENSRPSVIFLDYCDDIDRAAARISAICSRAADKPIVVVTSNFNIGALKKFSDALVVNFDKLLSRQDYEFMDRCSLDLARSWYSWLKPVEGITEYKGIKFGFIVEEKAYRFFASVIKRQEIVLKIIERFKPAELILVGEKAVFQRMADFIRDEFGIPVAFVKYGEDNFSFTGLFGKIKRICLEKASNIFDAFVRGYTIRKKITGAVFVDSRLHDDLKDLNKEFFVFQYLIEKGIRARLRLLRAAGLVFAPLVSEDTLRLLDLSRFFGKYGKYWSMISADAEFKKRFEYKKIKVWRLMERALRELIVRDFPRVSGNAVFLEKLFKENAPRSIVLREAVRETERTIVSYARQARIPSLVILHGLLTGSSVYRTLLSDKIALWGGAGMEWYGQSGNNSERCVVTGKPQHDRYFLEATEYQKRGKEFLSGIGVDMKKDRILYVTAYFKWAKNNAQFLYDCPSFEYLALESIVKAMEYFPDKQLVVKMHPFDGMDPEELYDFTGRRPNIFIVKKEDITGLIENSDLVITSLFSSAALDAVIANKPIITLNFYNREDLIPFTKRGVALTVTNPDELRRAIQDVLQDKKLKDWFVSNRESFIYDYAYRIDGKATQRIKELIKEMSN